MNAELIDEQNDVIALAYNGERLFTYHYQPDTAQSESPKPFFHPLKTLQGNAVTVFRPHDHRWHTGLMMTLAHVSGQNFWGGPSYIRDKGYEQLDNNGRQQHQEWKRKERHNDGWILEEELAWITFAGETWFRETRRIEIAQINPDEGYWVLAFGSSLTNVSGQTLQVGSPTTEGRPGAGYGGLFWRGPRAFSGGRILGADSLEGEEMMGQRSPWLAFVGKHDEVNAASTLIFVDDPANPRHPTQWFVRSKVYACASFAFMFDKEYELPHDDGLELNYRIVIADGEWERDQIEQVAAGNLRGLSPTP